MEAVQEIGVESKPNKSETRDRPITTQESFLDADEDHISSSMKEAIQRKNAHKVNYLQTENSQIKLLLEDALKNIEVNKNIINAKWAKSSII